MLATASRRQGLSAARWASSVHRKLPSVSRGAVSALQDAFASLATNSNTTNGNYHHQQQSIRFFAAAPPPDDKKEEKDEGLIRRTFHRILTPQNQFYALVAGGTIGAYAISKVFLSFTNFFTHLTPTVVAKWGFYTGFGCATGESNVTVCLNHVFGDVFCGARRNAHERMIEVNDLERSNHCFINLYIAYNFCGSCRWTGTGNSRQYVHSCRSCL